jgi:hypothetical protein
MVVAVISDKQFETLTVVLLAVICDVILCEVSDKSLISLRAGFGCSTAHKKEVELFTSVVCGDSPLSFQATIDHEILQESPASSRHFGSGMGAILDQLQDAQGKPRWVVSARTMVESPHIFVS